MKLRLLTAIICIAAFVSGISAQQPGPPTVQPQGQQPGMGNQTTSTKGSVIKGKAPVNKNLLKVKLPRAQEATLKNGLHVVLLESNHKLPIFTMEMVVMTGGLADPADMRGLANATAVLLREGTAKRNSRELSEQLDTLGATYQANAGVSSITTNISTGGLVESFDQILDLFAEVIRTPKFPTEEVERYKSRTLSQQPLLRGNPTFLAQERLAQAIYSTHPASVVVAPPEALKKITAADVTRFHAQNYVPNNATLFIAGDVTLAQVLPKLERVFGDWQRGTPQTVSLPEVPAQADTKIH